MIPNGLADELVCSFLLIHGSFSKVKQTFLPLYHCSLNDDTQRLNYETPLRTEFFYSSAHSCSES